MRTNIVGTHWLCVTRYCSMSSRARLASNFSIITTVPPSACTDAQKRSGAAWYIGAGDR